MSIWLDLLGTVKTTFTINKKAKFDAAILTALRTITLPDSNMDFSSGSNDQYLKKTAGGIGFAAVSGGGGTGTFLSGNSNIAGTYEGGLYIDGNATLTDNLIVKGNLHVLGNLIDHAGYSITINGIVIVTGYMDLENTSTGIAPVVTIDGDLYVLETDSNNVAINVIHDASPKTALRSEVFVSGTLSEGVITGDIRNLVVEGNKTFNSGWDTNAVISGNHAYLNGKSIICTASTNGNTGKTATITNAWYDDMMMETNITINPGWGGDLSGDVFDYGYFDTGSVSVGDYIYTASFGGGTFRRSKVTRVYYDSGTDTTTVNFTPSWSGGSYAGEGFDGERYSTSTFFVGGSIYAANFMGLGGTIADNIPANGVNLTINGDFVGGILANTISLDINLNGSEGSKGGNLTVNGKVANVGIKTNGGNVSSTNINAGDAGNILIMGGYHAGGAQTALYSLNTIEAQGGAATAYIPDSNYAILGNGGSITIHGGCECGGYNPFSTGIKISGGYTDNPSCDLTNGKTGNGGNLFVYGNLFGSSYSGVVSTNGGSNAGLGPIGTSGTIAVRGDIVGFSRIDTYGGSASDTNNGGNGGAVSVYGNLTGGNLSDPTCTLNASGGTSTGGTGGSGGDFNCTGNVKIRVNCYGGTGVTYGNGGRCSSNGDIIGDINVSGRVSGNVYTYNMVGSINASGYGDGNGGTVYVYGNFNGYQINTKGGSNASGRGGNGGDLTIYGKAIVRLSIDSSGGNSTAGNSNGAPGNQIFYGGLDSPLCTLKDGTGGTAITTSKRLTLGGVNCITNIDMSNRAALGIIAHTKQTTLCVGVLTAKNTFRKGAARTVETGAVVPLGKYYSWDETTANWYEFTGVLKA